MSGIWSQASINKDMAAFIGKYVWDIPATSSGTVTPYFIYRANTTCSWACWCTTTVKMMYIDHNSHIVLWLTMMEGQQSLKLHWQSFSRWGEEHDVFSFSYNGSQYIVYDCLQPVALQITQDTQPTIVGALLTLIFKIGQGGYRSVLCLYRRPEIRL